MKKPLYKIIFNDLRDRILSEKLKLDSPVPTEKELSESYQVSRITSKRALNELEQAGFIYRVRGKGSFVKRMPQANSQRASRTATRVLFLLPFLHDLSLGNFTEGLLPVMQQNKIEVIMDTMHLFHHKDANELMNEYDGLIYYEEDTDQHLNTFVQLSLAAFPVISLDKKNFELDFPAILSDDLISGMLATQELIDEKHTQIAYLFRNKSYPPSVRKRYIGYLSALHKANLNYYTSSVESTGINAHLINDVKEQQITAFVCENDLVAMEAMQLFKRNGYKLPDDLSIIGFDNIQAAHFVDPPLSTIAQDFKKIGEIAGKALINWIENNVILEDVKVPVTLIRRQSINKINI